MPPGSRAITPVCGPPNWCGTFFTIFSCITVAVLKTIPRIDERLFPGLTGPQVGIALKRAAIGAGVPTALLRHRAMVPICNALKIHAILETVPAMILPAQEVRCQLTAPIAFLLDRRCPGTLVGHGRSTVSA